MRRNGPVRSFAGALVGAMLLAACGQKGPLYLPDEATGIVTRPTQTPPAPQGDAPNTPQTIDTPPAPAPAPSDSAPEATPEEQPVDKDKKDPGATTPR